MQQCVELLYTCPKKSHYCHQYVVTWLRSSSEHEANYALKWSSTRSQWGIPQSCLIYRDSTHYPPGNRCIHALSNPQNGMRILDTRVQHLTLLLTYWLTQLYDTTQPYIYPATYGSWDIQKQLIRHNFTTPTSPHTQLYYMISYLIETCTEEKLHSHAARTEKDSSEQLHVLPSFLHSEGQQKGSLPATFNKASHSYSEYFRNCRW